MKIIIVLMIMNIGFAQDFTVDGDLNVSGNKVLNVADPTAETDAVNMRTLNEAGGMKVERIYTYQKSNNDDDVTFNVPADKVWYIICLGGYSTSGIRINDVWVYTNGSYNPGGNSLWAHPNDEIYLSESGAYHLSILEYSFSNSGTSQGMDYIEP